MIETEVLETWRIVERIRESQLVCCFNIHSDYAYVWDITWVFSADDAHKKQSLNVSYPNLLDAVKAAEKRIFT